MAKGGDILAEREQCKKNYERRRNGKEASSCSDSRDNVEGSVERKAREQLRDGTKQHKGMEGKTK